LRLHHVASSGSRESFTQALSEGRSEETSEMLGAHEAATAEAQVLTERAEQQSRVPASSGSSWRTQRESARA